MSVIDAEYNRLINELSVINREISAYRRRNASSVVHNWHEELEEILDRHRAVTARLREISELRTVS